MYLIQLPCKSVVANPIIRPIVPDGLSASASTCTQDRKDWDGSKDDDPGPWHATFHICHLLPWKKAGHVFAAIALPIVHGHFSLGKLPPNLFSPHYSAIIFVLPFWSPKHTHSAQLNLLQLFGFPLFCFVSIFFNKIQRFTRDLKTALYLYHEQK